MANGERQNDSKAGNNQATGRQGGGRQGGTASRGNQATGRQGGSSKPGGSPKQASGKTASSRQGGTSHAGRQGASSQPARGQNAKTARNRQIADGSGQGRFGGGRSTVFMAWGAVFIVIVIVAVVVVVKLTGSSSTSKHTLSQLAPASVVKDVTAIPLSEYTSVGLPNSSLTKTISFSPPIKMKGQPSLKGLASGNKPEVFFFGADYCPFCATERWPLVMALSRFGTFSNLHITTSSAIDVYPQTNTFSFYKSSYSSPYLSFIPVEYETNQPLASGNGYTPLMTPTKLENTIVSKYDGPPYTGPQTSSSSSGAIPFVDIGNKAIISGASYTPQLLSGLNWYNIASQIKGGKTTLARAAIGVANYISGAICSITNDQPSSVCNSAPVKTAQSNLGLG